MIRAGGLSRLPSRGPITKTSKPVQVAHDVSFAGAGVGIPAGSFSSPAPFVGTVLETVARFDGAFDGAGCSFGSVSETVLVKGGLTGLESVNHGLTGFDLTTAPC